MKKGQTSSRNGYQDVLFPMEHLRITQGDNEGTHKGSNAVDLAGKDTGKCFAYFPVDMVSKYLDTPKNGNAVFWESQNKVRFADGSIDYLTMMVIHDDDPTGFEPGKKYKQGQQMAEEGTAGQATGNHLHVEVAKGKYSKPYVQNKYGVYMLPNNIPCEEVFHLDGTEILNCKHVKWKYLKDTKPQDEITKEQYDKVCKERDNLKMKLDEVKSIVNY